MKTSFYLDLAAAGLRMPIGTDLFLHEHPDAEQIVHDGLRLGQAVEQAARQYGSPLALPLMDLRLEKRDLLGMLGIAAPDIDAFHFPKAPGEETLEQVRASCQVPFGGRQQAHLDALRYIAQKTDLVAVGMSIGPFSLMTKLIADPITAIALAGLGVQPEEDAGVLLVHRALALAEAVISRSLRAQIEAGAQAVMFCEPAANRVYLSPKQIAAGSNIFERFVLEPNVRLRRQLAEAGADLIFHDCGELTDVMVQRFATRLDPSILSLGSSRRLWEDSRLIPNHVVLFGNLPTKSFYSDGAMPADEVRRLTQVTLRRMQDAGHPHILGSECDVLHVPEAAKTIRRKVEIMLTCAGHEAAESYVDLPA